MKFKARITVASIVALVTAFLYILVGLFDTSIVIATSIKILRGLQITLGMATALAIVFVLCNVVLYLNFIRRNMADGIRKNKEAVNTQSDPVKKLLYGINKYMSENVSTEFFREQLINMQQLLPRLQKQINGAEEVASIRFGAESISYNQFILPVQHLFDHLIKLGNDLVQKLEMFDEESYQNKIVSNKNKAKDYIDVMYDYKEYAKAVSNSFESATVKLDKLILEIGKLSNEDLRCSIEALQDIDTIITNTKLYKN